MTRLFEDRDAAEIAADKLRAFAQSQRLMILSLLLAKGEQSVSAIDLSTGIGQPTLSQQLGELRRAALVATRRQSKQVYYRLADDSAARCVRSIETAFGPANLDGGASRPEAFDRPPDNDIASGAARFVRMLAAS